MSRYLDRLRDLPRGAKNLERPTRPSVESVETPEKGSIDTLDTAPSGPSQNFTPTIIDLAHRGIELRISDGRLIARPATLIDEPMREFIRRHKAELLDVVRWLDLVGEDYKVTRGECLVAALSEPERLAAIRRDLAIRDLDMAPEHRAAMLAQA